MTTGGPPATATENLLSVCRWAAGSGRGRWCSVSGVLHRARGFWTRPCGHAASLLGPGSLSSVGGARFCPSGVAHLPAVVDDTAAISCAHSRVDTWSPSSQV